MPSPAAKARPTDRRRDAIGYASLSALALPIVAGIADLNLGLPWYVVVLSTLPALAIAVLSMAFHPLFRHPAQFWLGWCCGIMSIMLIGGYLQFAGLPSLQPIGNLMIVGLGPLWLAFPFILQRFGKRMHNVDYWRRRGEKGTTQLIDVLQNGGVFIGSLDAAEYLGQLGDSRAVEPLIAEAGNNPDPVIRQAAATALGKLGDARALPILLEMLENDQGLDDEGQLIRPLIAAAIGNLRRRAPGGPA